MRARDKVLGLLFLLTVITYLDRVCIGTTASLMAKDLGLSPRQMGTVFSAFILGYVLFEVPGGWLADRFGARLLLPRIVVWWSVFTAATGYAWSYGSLIVIRFLFGAGEAGAFPASSTVVLRWFPAAERGRANGILLMGSRLGGAVAPALVITLMNSLGWRHTFTAFAGLGILWAAAWFVWYRNDPKEHPAVSAAELAEIGPGTAWGKPKVDWKRLWRSRNLWALCAMYSGYTYGLYFSRISVLGSRTVESIHPAVSGWAVEARFFRPGGPLAAPNNQFWPSGVGERARTASSRGHFSDTSPSGASFLNDSLLPTALTTPPAPAAPRSAAASHRTAAASDGFPPAAAGSSGRASPTGRPS